MLKRARKATRGVASAASPAPSPPLFAADEIVDAPEHHEYARAMGLLTWGTWDADPRPFEDRLRDFLQAYPPEAPSRFQGPMLAKTADGEYGPAPPGARRERIEALDNSFGALAEVLGRYGLKRRAAAPYTACEIEVAPFREVTRARNQRLRVLHGKVDVEAENMDAAKLAEIERLEKRRAAEQIREARERMRHEAGDGE